MAVMTLSAGQLAPPFEARSDDGRRYSLSELRGGWTVLYFFPRALTRDCNLEARQFEALLPAFEQHRAQVIGVSTDTEARQALFRDTCQLSFALLPDSARSLAGLYGVLGGLSGWLGRTQRCTFLIDPQGVIAHVWRKVAPDGHAAEVLAELQARQATPD